MDSMHLDNNNYYIVILARGFRNINIFCGYDYYLEATWVLLA